MADGEARPEIAVTVEQHRSGSPPMRVTRRDVLLAAATAAAAIIALSVDEEGIEPGSEAVAYLLMLVGAAPIAMRRRRPLAMLIAVACVTLVAYSLGHPGGPATVPVLVALYLAAAEGERAWSFSVAAFFAASGLAYRWLVENEALVEPVFHATLFGLVVLLGDAVFARRKLAVETSERLRLTAEQRKAVVERRLSQERMRIAHELHDVMAHTVTTMAVQAGAASDLLETDPAAARTALSAVRSAARDAMTELRATIGLLRTGDVSASGARSPSPRLDNVGELVEVAQASGLDVELRVHGQPRPLPASIELTCYRVAQEALTNVVRHAHARTAMVRLDYAQDEIRIQVDDDGQGPAGRDDTGFGLIGLRERVEAAGGDLYAGPGPAHGFRVRAGLPLPKDR